MRIAVVLLALALAFPAAASAARVERGCDPLVAAIDCPVAPLTVTAAPGERNRIVLSHDGRAVTVRDSAAPPTAGPGCTQAAPDAVRCDAPLVTTGDPLPVRVDAGDGDDVVDATALGAAGVLLDLALTGGAGDDALAIGEVRVPSASSNWPIPRADGGPGRDWLAGGGQRDALSGGDGPDVLIGGEGDDFLAGDPGEAIAPDVLGGGAGTDTAGYEDRTAALTVDLADDAPDGSPGEGDRLSAIENVFSGSGDTILRGDDGPNRLHAPYGNRGVVSRVDGRGGDDQLTGRTVDGGDGDDVVSARTRARCGPGVDVLFDPRLLAPRPPRDCERLELDGLIVDARTLRVAGRSVTLRVQRSERGRGRLLLRVAGRTAGRRRVPAGDGARRIAVRLDAAGARALRRARGALAVVYDPAAPGVPTRGFRTVARR